MTDERDNVFPLPPEASGAHMTPPPPPSKHGRLHGFLVGATAASAVVAILSMLAFVTVTWPDTTSRILIGIFLFSLLGFFASASAAVFTAAQATHARPHSVRGK